MNRDACRTLAALTAQGKLSQDEVKTASTRREAQLDLRPSPLDLFPAPSLSHPSLRLHSCATGSAERPEAPVLSHTVRPSSLRRQR